MSDNRSCVEPVPGENHFEALYEDAPLGYQSLDAEGRVLQVNRTWLELLGYARNEVIGRSFADLLTAAQRPCFAECFARFKEAGEVRAVEFEMVRKDGGILVASFDGRIGRDEHGRFLRTHCILSDVTERKRAETNLRNRESLLEKIFDILPIGLWFVDKSGKLTRGNPAGVAIWGDEPQVAPADYGVFKARRLPSGEDIAPDDWALAHTIRDGVTIVDELLEIDAFDGKKKTILDSTAPVLDDRGAIQGAIVVNQDITERWKAEQALRESALRQAMAVQAGNVGLWDWDLLTNKVVYSREWKSQIGYEEDEISDSFEEWRNRIHPEDLEPVSNEIQAYVAQRRPSFATEFRFRHKDGPFRWIMVHGSVVKDETGRAVRVMGAHIDITERKRMEAARRQSDERYRRVIEMANEGFLILDADDRVTFANRRMAEMLGYPESVLEGRPVTDLVAEEDLSDHRARMEKRRQGCDDRYERRLRRQDGDICHALVSASAIHDETGRFAGSFGMYTDITRAKDDEERLSAMKEQLRHAGRLAALGALSAGIAHEVNQPLCAILNFANACKNVAAQENPDMTLIIQWSDAIAAAAARSGDIVRRMSGFSRRSVMQFRQVSVRELIEDAAMLVRFEAGRRKVTIMRRFPNEEWFVTVHPVQIHQVLVNLLKNAIEAFDDDGLTPRQVVVAVDATGDTIRFQVTDNGPGLGNTDPNKLFTAFFTTKPEGLGMGLSISRTIVENHGGRIGAAANEEGGLTVSFTLPIKHGEDES